MGVWDKPRHRAMTVVETDGSSETAEDVLSLAGSETTTAGSEIGAGDFELLPQPEQVPRRKGKRSGGRRGTGVGSGSVDLKRGSGKRARHRGDNLAALIALLGEDGDVGADLDAGAVLLEEALSAFARILDDPSLMQLWEEFTARSEEEQRRFLAQAAKLERGRRHDEEVSLKPIVEEEKETEEGFVTVDHEGTVLKKVPRVHATPEAAFRGINAHLRSLLLRRHFPLGILARQEEELVSFFRDFPDAVFISPPLPSMDRLILHALAQFYQLKAESFNDETKENKNPAVETRRSAKQDTKRTKVEMTEQAGLSISSHSLLKMVEDGRMTAGN